MDIQQPEKKSRGIFWKGIATALAGGVLLTTAALSAAPGRFMPTMKLDFVIPDLLHILSVDSDKDGMPNITENDLMRKFAPLVHFHPSETSYMADVNWALSKVNLRHNSDNFCSDRLVYNYGQVTAQRLVQTTVAGKGRSGFRLCGNTSNRYHTWIKYGANKSFYMNVPTEIYGGNLANAKCYAHVRPGRVNGSSYLINYWFYYPYNPAYRGIAGGHQGDWENIQVRVNADRSLNSVRYFAHGSEYKDRVPGGGGFWTTDDGRPYVYSARWTHASYPESGTHWRAGAAIATPDYTANGGQKVDCAEAGRTINVGNFNYPFFSQIWIRYKGFWGFKQTSGRAGGPSGPNMYD